MANGLNMAELPELVICLIAKHLSYEDMQTLRVTCKQLKAILDQRTFTSLHLFVETYPFERELLHTGELVSYANTCHVREQNILKSIKFKSQFTGLRKLSIYHGTLPPWNEFKIVDPKDLNCLEQLVHLELEGVAIENGSLRLRSLRIAFFENANHETNFELDCPRLKVLGLGWRTECRPTSNTSASITHLYIRSTQDMEIFLAKLRNLSTICFNRQRSGEFLNGFVVAVIERRVQLPSLKRIDLREAWGFPERGVLLRNLSNLQSRCETRHIEVQINGKVMSPSVLAELLNLLGQSGSARIRADDSEEFYFGLLKGDLIRHFSENPLLDCLLPGVKGLVLSKEDFPVGRQLIGKLRNLQSLGIEEEFGLGEEFFKCFLKTCRRTEGIMACDFLNQQQLDLIPNYLQKLRQLRFKRDVWQGDLNLKFVAKLKNLSVVRFGFNIQKKAMSFLLKNCNNHRYFELMISGMQTIWILGQPNKNGRFKVLCGRQQHNNVWLHHHIGNKIREAQFDNIDDAIEHYYRDNLFNTPWSMPPQDS